MNRASSCLVGLALVVLPAEAFACSIIIDDHSAKAKLSRAKNAIDRSTAIIDGEVVRVGSQDEPALVYAHNVLRGPQERWFLVGGNDNGCSLVLDRLGERARMLLFGGPEVYDLQIDASNASYEDRILGSDRERDYPYFPGPRP